MINLKPRTWEQLDDTVAAFKGELEAMKATPNDPSKHESFVKVAADLAGAVESAKQAQKDATLAMELARDVAAAGPGKKVSPEALKNLPLIYRLENSPDLSAMFGGRNAQFNLLNYAKSDLVGFDSDVVTKIERFRYLNAQLSVMHALMLAQGPTGRDQYSSRGGRDSLPFWKEWVELSREFKAAMDTAESGAGSEWVPTGVNMTLIPDVRPEHMTRSMFQTYNMTRSPQIFPVQGVAFRAFLLGESTAVHRSATVIGQRDAATANTTFTAKKFGALTDYSRELLQDSIVALATIVRVEHAYAHGETDESIIWNAQLGTGGMGGTAAASSSFDTGETFATTTNAVDDRAAWDGIRLMYSNGSCTTPDDAGAGLFADMFTNQFGQMKRFGVDPSRQFIGTSFLGFAKALVLRFAGDGSPVVLTRAQAGDAWTFGTGVLAAIFARALVPSTQYPQTMNASGIMDGSGARTGYHIVSRERFGVGEVQTLEIASSDQVAFDTDQIVVRSISRKHFKAYVAPNSTTETTIGAILNV